MLSEDEVGNEAEDDADGPPLKGFKKEIVDEVTGDTGVNKDDVAELAVEATVSFVATALYSC